MTALPAYYCRFTEDAESCWCTVCLKPLKVSEHMRRANQGDMTRHRRPCAGIPPVPIEQPDVPAIGKRAGNAAKSLVKAAKYKGPPITDAQIAERALICLNCPRFRRNGPDTAEGICTHPDCGCPVSPMRKLRNKASRPEQNCPDHLWPPLVTTPE